MVASPFSPPDAEFHDSRRDGRVSGWFRLPPAAIVRVSRPAVPAATRLPKRPCFARLTPELNRCLRTCDNVQHNGARRQISRTAHYPYVLYYYPHRDTWLGVSKE